MSAVTGEEVHGNISAISFDILQGGIKKIK
jgi:hypothetical protein